MPASLGIIYSFQDGKGDTSTTILNLPSTTSITDATIWARSLAAVIDTLITGQITRVGISLTVDISGLGLKTAAAANSDVEEGAYFQWLTNGGFRTSNRIPTFDETLITAGGTSVDQTDLDVFNFISAMENGVDITALGGSGTIAPTDSRDDDVVSLTIAEEAFRSSR